MTTHVVVLGAGAAGTAAARVLSASDAIAVTLIAHTAEVPYNRTLVNKGVAIGLLSAEQAALPSVPSVPIHRDTAQHIDTNARIVSLASGAEIPYDALIIATGSAPRDVDGVVEGAAAAVAAGQLTALHSLDDAVRVQAALARLGVAHIVVFGAGLVAAETASLLHEKGHYVTIVARADVPGVSAFGAEVATRLAALHRSKVDTRFGRSAVALAPEGDGLCISLDDGTRLRADLVIVAHGTTPTAPSPFRDGVSTDGWLRATAPGVYGAGGVAVHRGGGSGPWRIDHWADAAAQGEHAARTVLHDVGVGEDPGPYLPRSPHTASIHGAVLAAVGRTGEGGAVVSTEPLVVANEHDGVLWGASGIDAVPAVFGLMSYLHQRRIVDNQQSC